MCAKRYIYIYTHIGVVYMLKQLMGKCAHIYIYIDGDSRVVLFGVVYIIEFPIRNLVVTTENYTGDSRQTCGRSVEHSVASRCRIPAGLDINLHSLYTYTCIYRCMHTYTHILLCVCMEHSDFSGILDCVENMAPPSQRAPGDCGENDNVAAFQLVEDTCAKSCATN